VNASVLADVLAHPVKHLVLSQQHLVEGEPSPFARRILAAVEPKLNRHLYSGKIEGYGTVIFPKQK
jgi:hypothetical protein